MNDQYQVSTRLALADDIKGFGAINLQRFPVNTRLELQWHHPHANQVGAVNALETFGHNDFNTCESYTLRGPVTR